VTVVPNSKADHVETFKTSLRRLLKGYEFDIVGLYRKNSDILPLPRESSLIGKVLEVTIKWHLDKRVLSTKGLEFTRGGERSYPDLTIYGTAVGGHRYAVDVKCVRRNEKGSRTESAMGLATFDANYFRHPDDPDPNIVAPYNSYDAHLVLVALYDYADATARNVELLVVEKWRIASRKRASGTRCYVAAMTEIDKIRKEQGEFESEEEFNAYWRAIPIPEKKVRTKKPKKGAESTDMD
jgi:hypothetical protein